MSAMFVTAELCRLLVKGRTCDGHKRFQHLIRRSCHLPTLQTWTATEIYPDLLPNQHVSNSVLLPRIFALSRNEALK